MAWTTPSGTVTFGLSEPATPASNNAKLRNIALDSLAKELDQISTIAANASLRLRQLRPLLPTGDKPRKSRNY